MQFDPTNKVVQLCAQGMEQEGKGDPESAARLFMQAWEEATTAFEQFTAAHYVARHQHNPADKLHWDQAALQFALKIEDHAVNATYPSLYLNIAKCHEDLGDLDNARRHYELAHSFAAFLPDDGYGNMIKSGIRKGLERVNA